MINFNPFGHFVIGNKFNYNYKMFKSDIDFHNKKTDLAKWSINSNINFIKEPNRTIQYAEYVLNLTFSNILYIQFIIRKNIRYKSDHKIQIMVILNKENFPLIQNHSKIIKINLSKFVDLINNKIIHQQIYGKSRILKNWINLFSILRMFLL